MPRWLPGHWPVSDPLCWQQHRPGWSWFKPPG
uniref:Uncharacterized protein n=1 Tax=Magnetospirillum gryphiswaldense TaxID=55518 RepID=A4TXV7_9PROT|nr:hypothetical protein MGR_3462 [Magnetospirillum gryphiswaldense MSR-1]